ncbi:MAG TPA: hypothetical protein VFR03_15160 [Thermoanaerobaculia bacterium]|nr:hypothetical protein [Thermoanaerobaculia bacterium]
MLKNPVAAYRLAGRILALAFLGALATVPARVSAQTSCSPTPTVLCLQGSRFQAEVTWTAPGFGSGPGRAVPLTGDTGYFWFFSDSNVELMVKVLDGRAVNRHFWVFYGALSDVAYTLTVTDLQTGAKEVFTNPGGRLASVSNTSAFNPEAPPGAASPAAAASSSPEAPLSMGPEFQANVTTDGDQYLPAVAMAPDGSFMVVWTQNPNPFAANGPFDLSGRIYDANGNPRTGEIRLNETPFTGYQPRARVAANAAGAFMVVWSDSQFQARHARARLVGSGGQPLGGVIELAAGNDAGFPFLSPPDVTADPAGGFLAAWIEYGGLGDTVLAAQRFDAQGGRLGGPAELSAQNSTEPPRLAAFPGGGFLAAWATVGSLTDSFVSDLWAQRLDASGQPVGASILLNPEGQLGGKALIAPVAYADGGFSVIWVLTQLLGPVEDGLHARRFAADGTPAGGITAIRPPFSATTTAPAAIALPSGDTWILWDHAGTHEELINGIYSGVFDSAWALQGEVTRVSTFSGSPNVQIDPAAAAAGVHAVAFWASGLYPVPFEAPHAQDGSGFGVFGQRFTLPGGCAAGPSQLCLGARFRVQVQFTDPRNGQASAGTPVPITGDTGAFWFFSPSNLELIVKVLDGRAVNGHFWVFYGALSDVEYTITVTDTVTGGQRTYHNNPHHLASGSDVAAF